ncbi:MAG TPA: Minf_1886 family protein [Planctomycetaceae bacterium]
MNTLTKSPVKSRPRYHRNAYHFVFSALQFTQEKLNRTAAHVLHEEDAHITGQELCEGLRELALQKFGLLTKTVLRHWGVTSTDDIGRIVFELIERGEMRKTEHDALDHFLDLYDFDEAFDRAYPVDVSKAFRDN